MMPSTQQQIINKIVDYIEENIVSMSEDEISRFKKFLEKIFYFI